MMRIPSSLVLAGLLSFSACGGKYDVVLYCATDQKTSEQVVRLFENKTGLKVKARYDTEANKTVGLVNALMEEAKQPRCDVFWNNEIVHTARLMKRGLLAPYQSPMAKDIPLQFQGPEHHWTGFAARARVLIINTNKLPADKKEQWPQSMWDLVHARFKGQSTMARPLTGTTLTHIAAIFTTLGEKEGMRFLDGLKSNETAMVASNGATMRDVGEGRVAFGFTDTDDYNVAKTVKEWPVDVVFPDKDGMGTLLIPNTVALIKGGPNSENAKKLIDFLLSPEVEQFLAESRSAQIPVRDSVKRPAHVRKIGEIKVMEWDPIQAAEWMDQNLKMLINRDW
jgi:iron(III) transport system substrate-binding protein